VHLQATDVSVQFYRKFGFEDVYKKFCFKNDPKSAYFEMVYHLNDVNGQLKLAARS
jgi:hypothetical protein